MRRVACLLLAAGRSLRMQGPNKLLLRLKETTLVRRTGCEIARVSFTQRIAITGHDAEAVSVELSDLPIEIVHNGEFFTGMHSSIRAGLLQLKECDAFFICLADQPYFQAQVLNQLILSANRNQIIFPLYNGLRGQPTLIGADFIPEILAHADGDHGCHYLFERHPDNVKAIPIDAAEMRFDIDQPEDYQIYLQKMFFQ